jgi:type IV secretion system protein VirB11
LTSVHADSPALAFERLALMVMQGNAALTREQILAYLRGVVDIVVQVRKIMDRRVVAAIYYKHTQRGGL